MNIVINETEDSATVSPAQPVAEHVIVEGTANYAPAGPPGPAGIAGADGVAGSTGISVVSIDNTLVAQTAVVHYSDGSTSNLPLPHPNIVEYSWDDPHSYIAVAPHGSLTTDSVWRITRIEMLPDGSTVTGISSDVAWTDRLTEVYI